MAAMLAFLSLCAFLSISQAAADNSLTNTDSPCLVSLVIDLALQLKEQGRQLHSLQSAITALESSPALKADNNIRPLNKTCAEAVAFSVNYNSQGAINVGPEGTLKYNNVVSNEGGGYNPITGLFTAPCTGSYAFFTSLRSVNDQLWILLAIYKGDTKLAEATAEGRGDHWDRGSVFVTTPMAKGEHAYVRQTGGGTFLEAGSLTTFSGFLVG